MTGSLQVKKNKYYMVLNTYTSDGKRKPKWEATGLDVRGNKKKAEQMLRERLATFDEIKERSSDILFADWVQQWFDEASKSVGEVTIHGYSDVIRLHIRPYFCNLGVTLGRVTWEILQEFFDEKSEHGRVDGTGGLSPKSLRHIRNVVHLALKEAVKRRIVPSNACELVRLPQEQQPNYSFMSADQVSEFLTAISNEPIYPIVKLTATYGLRRSEVMGLKWDSVDFESNTFVIHMRHP